MAEHLPSSKIEQHLIEWQFLSSSLITLCFSRFKKMASADNEEIEDLSINQQPWKTRRKRSRNLIERVVMRNFGAIIRENKAAIGSELSEIERVWSEEKKFEEISNFLQKSLTFRPPKPGKIQSEKSRYYPALEFLNTNLVFKRVLPDPTKPLSKLSKAEGMRYSIKLSWFLRHRLGSECVQYSRMDGSVQIEKAEKSLRISREKILIAVHPEYDEEKKRCFVVLEHIYPDASKSMRVAALGGHSVAITSPPGHYLLGKESLCQLCPLIHNTSSAREIQESGFLSQQQRLGGISLCSKQNKYRKKSTHEIHIDAQRALKDGFTFFGNRFSEVIFCTGKWEGIGWNGKIPLEYLHINQRNL